MVGLRRPAYSIVSTHRRDSSTLMDNKNLNGKSNGPLVEIIGSDATKNINSTQTHILGEFLAVLNRKHWRNTRCSSWVIAIGTVVKEGARILWQGGSGTVAPRGDTTDAVEEEEDERRDNDRVIIDSDWVLLEPLTD